MNQVIYLFQTDTKYYNHLVEESWLFSTVALAGIFFLFFTVIYKKKKLSLIIISIILAIGMWSIYSNPKNKNTLKYIIDNKLYSITGGTISHFHPMPKSGHDTERFDVNNTHFEISYTGDHPKRKTMYYTLTKNKKGPIKRNGQHVKIHYIKVGAFSLCLPFLSKCLEFNKATENKIIKMWIYD